MAITGLVVALFALVAIQRVGQNSDEVQENSRRRMNVTESQLARDIRVAAQVS